MKKVGIILLLSFMTTFLFSTVADAKYVKGYFRKSGKYVHSYYRKSPHKRYR